MAELLGVDDLTAGYGDAMVLSGVSFALGEGEALALLGRNGMGKTTLVNTLIGLTTWRGGAIRFAGIDVARHKPEQIAHAGIGWVPQERHIFASLSVEENLTVIARPGRWSLARLYDLFPRLAERRRNLGTQLSGGEQQMLAIARALALNPRLLLLDEPLEGLAPIIVDELLHTLRRIVRDEGLAAIIVEQKARKILGMTSRALILERGSVVYSGASGDLVADDAALERHLGVVGPGRAAAGALSPRSRGTAR